MRKPAHADETRYIIPHIVSVLQFALISALSNNHKKWQLPGRAL